MSKNTKRPKNWSYTKKKWLEKYPPDPEGNYICALCNKPVHHTKVSLDHILPFALYPEYGSELSNLRPTHAFCNQERATPQLTILRNRKIIGIRRK